MAIDFSGGIWNVSPYGPDIISRALAYGKGLADTIGQYNTDKSQELDNQKAQMLMPYVVPNAQADLGLKQAEIPYTQAETANVQAETKFMPLKELIAAQTALNSVSRFGQAYQLNKTLMAMDPAARNAWIAQNQQAYNDMLATLGNKAFLSAETVLTPQIIKQLLPANLQSALPNIGNVSAQSNVNTLSLPQSPSIPNNAQSATINAPINLPSPEINPKNVISALINGSLNGLGRSPNNVNTSVGNQGTTTPSVFSSTPEQVKQIQLASEMAANRKSTGAPLQNRYEAAITVENLLNSPSVAQGLNTLAKYSGMVGATDAQTQRLMNPSQWAEYSSARDQLSSILSGSIKQLEQMPTTEVGMNTAKNYFIMAQKALPRDPKAAFQFFNLGRQYLEAEGNALQKAANPIFSVNRFPTEIPFEQNVTIKIPTFNSKEEYQNWYKGLTPAEQNSVRKQLGEK